MSESSHDPFGDLRKKIGNGAPGAPGKPGTGKVGGPAHAEPPSGPRNVVDRNAPSSDSPSGAYADYMRHLGQGGNDSNLKREDILEALKKGVLKGGVDEAKQRLSDLNYSPEDVDIILGIQKPDATRHTWDPQRGVWIDNQNQNTFDPKSGLWTSPQGSVLDPDEGVWYNPQTGAAFDKGRWIPTSDARHPAYKDQVSDKIRSLVHNPEIDSISEKSNPQGFQYDTKATTIRDPNTGKQIKVNLKYDKAGNLVETTDWQRNPETGKMEPIAKDPLTGATRWLDQPAARQAAAPQMPQQQEQAPQRRPAAPATPAALPPAKIGNMNGGGGGTVDEHVSNFKNAYATHTMDLLHSGQINTGAANWMMQNPEIFLTRYLAAGGPTGFGGKLSAGGNLTSGGGGTDPYAFLQGNAGAADIMTTMQGQQFNPRERGAASSAQQKPQEAM